MNKKTLEQTMISQSRKEIEAIEGLPRELLQTAIEGMIEENFDLCRKLRKASIDVKNPVVAVTHIHLALLLMAYRDLDAVQREIQRLIALGREQSN